MYKGFLCLLLFLFVISCKDYEQIKTNAIREKLNEEFHIAFAEKEYNKAIALVNKDIELAPHLPFGYYNRGRVYLEKGEIQKGLQDISQAISYLDNITGTPTHKTSRIYSQRAIVYFHLKEYTKALEDINVALQYSPHNEENKSIRLRLYYYLHEFDLAIEDSNNIDNESKFGYDAFFIRVISSIYLCKYNFAVSELEYYINNEVDKPFAYSILAYAHYKQGNVQKSVECYQEAIKLDIRFKNDIDSIEHILFGLDEIKEIFNKIIYEIESS